MENVSGVSRADANGYRTVTQWAMAARQKGPLVPPGHYQVQVTAVDSLGISKAFTGLVIVAIAGNAVENTAGLVLAWKRRSDLAISVVKNSVAQISAFLFPVLVVVAIVMLQIARRTEVT